MDMLTSEKTSGGIPVVSLQIPDSKSVGYMVAVNTGSRDESPDIWGISHLLEHVVFRATKTRSSFQMSKEIEGAGGELNAFTAKEITAFYGVTISETVAKAKELVADIVANPLINADDTELEKKIVLQEISMWENDPESYIHKLFSEQLWRGHQLSQSEAGTTEVVKGLDNNDLRAYYGERYRIPNIAVFSCGSADPQDTLSWAEDNFDGMSGGKPNVRRPPERFGPGYKFIERKGDHCYVGMGFPAYSADHPDRGVLSMLSAILGSGSSSRLFQAVREEKALVYSIYNNIDQNSDASSMGTFMSATEENVLEAVETTASIYRSLREDGVDAEELERARNLVKGAMIRSAESTNRSMYTLARNFMLTGRPKTLKQRLDDLDAVTVEDVMRVARDIIRSDSINMVIYGNKTKSMKGFTVDRLDL